MNIEQCFTSYPDYEITVPTLRHLVPTTRPNYSGNETQKFLREIRQLNVQLLEQVNEMKSRLVALEEFVAHSTSDGK